MKIEKIEESKVYTVYTDSGRFVRYGADKWLDEKWEEMLYPDKQVEIEAAFQVAFKAHWEKVEFTFGPI